MSYFHVSGDQNRWKRSPFDLWLADGLAGVRDLAIIVYVMQAIL